MSNLNSLKKEFNRISKIENFDNTEDKLYLYLYTINDKWFLSENNMKNNINIPDFARPKLLNMALDDFAKKLVKGMITFGKNFSENNNNNYIIFSPLWSFNIKNTKFIFSLVNTMQGYNDAYPYAYPYSHNMRYINILCNPLTIGDYNIADDISEAFVELDYEDNFLNDEPTINVKYVNHKFKLFGEIKDSLEIIDRRIKESDDDIILYTEEETNESKITKNLKLDNIDL